MTATVCGAVLSSLFYDQSGCISDQEGLLLGKIVNQVKDKISDDQINNYQVETKIYIYSFTPQEKDNSFHNKKCQILESKISSSIPEGYQIVGWYHSRRNSTPRMSMKETCIHRNFLKMLPAERQKNFLFLLCTGFVSDNMSTHTLDYNFYQWNERNRKFQKSAVNVVNLGDTLHTEYKEDETCTVNTSTGLCASIVAQHESVLLDKTGKPLEVKKVLTLSDKLYDKLLEMTEVVAKSEKELHMLEAKVQERREILQKQKQAAQISASPPDHLQSIMETDTDSSLPKSKPTNEEAINIARQKREQRRREGTKYNHLPRHAIVTKSKSDHHSSHTRRLSSDDAYEKDLISLDSEKDIDTCFEKINSSMETNELLQNSHENTENETQQNSTTHSNDSSLENSFTKMAVQSEPCKIAKTPEVSSNADHFSFIEGVLAQAKSVKKDQDSNKDQGSSKDSMSVQIGGEVKLVDREEVDSSSNKNDVSKMNSGSTRNKGAQRTTRSQKSQNQHIDTSNVTGHMTKTRQSPRVRSQERHEHTAVDSQSERLTKNSSSKEPEIKSENLTVEKNGEKHECGKLNGSNSNDIEISSSPSF